MTGAMLHRAPSLRPAARLVGLFLPPLLGLLCCAESAHADPSFTHPPIGGTIGTTLNLNSDVEWPTDEVDPNLGNIRYSPRRDQRIRLFSSPRARSLKIYFSGGALMPGDASDAVELGWFGSAPSASETGQTMPFGIMNLPTTGTRSLMSPGGLLRFRTGPAPTSVLNQSEDDGFRTASISVSAPSTIADSATETLRPFERALVLLPATDSIVNLALPARGTNEGVSVAAWLEDPSNAPAKALGVWMRCNALPNAANFAHRQYFQPNVPIFIRPTSTCSGTWFVTVGSTAPSTRIVHVTASAHNTNRIVTGQKVGLKFNATSQQMVSVAYGLRSAAWRIYGLSEGTLLLKSFTFYNNETCGFLGCGGSACSICIAKEACRSNVTDGIMTICNPQTSDLLSGNLGLIDLPWGAAQTLAHEFGHQHMKLPDEYKDAGGCGSWGVCGHSLMELFNNNVHGLCNTADHRSVVQDLRTSPNRVLGPTGYACDGSAHVLDSQSAWTRWSQATPGQIVPTFSPQNLNYVRQMFTSRADLATVTIH